MSIVWQKTIGGSHYEVRSAGRTRRLYTNGVFHSQYHPDRPLAGGIWDLLWLPALFRPPGRVRRVLLLGVGGGAAIHALHRHVRPGEIVGVELNPVHLQVARRFFGVTDNLARLVQGDAVRWLQAYHGPRFDMIIDDLFGEENGEPVRAVPADGGWCRTLLRHLDPNGMLVMNHMGNHELDAGACRATAPLARRFASVYRLSLPAYENVIGVFLRNEGSRRVFNANLASLLVDVKKKTGLQLRRVTGTGPAGNRQA